MFVKFPQDHRIINVNGVPLLPAPWAKKNKKQPCTKNDREQKVEKNRTHPLAPLVVGYPPPLTNPPGSTAVGARWIC
jgi:hypothetical protein